MWQLGIHILYLILNEELFIAFNIILFFFLKIDVD